MGTVRELLPARLLPSTQQPHLGEGFLTRPCGKARNGKPCGSRTPLTPLAPMGCWRSSA